MTKFCENCPMRNEASGELDTIASGEVNYEVRAVMGKGPILDAHNGLAGVIADEENRPSMPMKFPGHDPESAKENYISRIETCTGPITEERGILRKKDRVVSCAAIGSAAIGHSMGSLILNKAHTELTQ